MMDLVFFNDSQMTTAIQLSSLLMECPPFVPLISVWMNGE
jgi:hypothetical protein